MRLPASRPGPAIAGGGCAYTPRGPRPPAPPPPILSLSLFLSNPPPRSLSLSLSLSFFFSLSLESPSPSSTSPPLVPQRTRSPLSTPLAPPVPHASLAGAASAHAVLAPLAPPKLLSTAVPRYSSPR